MGSLLLLTPPCVIGALILLLLLVALWMSLRIGLPVDASPLTLKNYEKVFSDPFTYKVLLNTVIFAAATMVTAVIIVIPLSLLLVRTDLPFKGMFESLLGVEILLPTFLTAMGWILLMSPRNGVINVWLMGLFGQSEAPFSVYSVPMMGYLQGLAFVPVAYYMLAASFRSMDPSLEEAARMSGASPLKTILRVTLPTARPAIVAALIYVVMITFAVFDIPAIIGAPLGMYIFSTAIYRAINPPFGLPDYGLAGAYGSIMLAVGLLLTYFYLRTIKASHKYVVVTGKAYQPRTIALGKWKWPALVFVAFYFIPAIVFPFAILVWTSLIPYLQVPSAEAWATVSLTRYLHVGDFLHLRPVINTTILIILAPTITIALSAIWSWLVIRSRIRGRQVLDTVAFLPHATPHILFAVSLAYLALIFRDFIPIYGTIVIILIAQVITFVSFGTRTMNSALIQLHPELEEAGRTARASVLTVLWRITLPLVRHAVINGWIWLALLSFREVTMAVILMRSEANTVVTTQVWRYWLQGNIAEASVLGVLMIIVMAGFVTVARRVGISLAER